MKEITLFIMSLKGLAVLESIIENEYKSLISKVVYAIDKSVVNDYSNDIVKLCKKNSISYTLRKKEIEIDSDIAIAISWRWLINVNENQKLIVLHDSLLPKYRGFAPLVTALLNKDRKIGVTALYATEEYDKGDIIQQEMLEVEYPLKINEAINKITECYIKIVLSLFHSIKNKILLEGIKQKEEYASYSVWRDEDDYQINWSWTADQIKTFVDAVGFPFKGASTYLESKKIRIHDVEILDDLKISNRPIGKVIFLKNNKPVIICGEGLIKILKASFDDSNENALPFKKFRSRLK